jgi:hypothetical protein
MPPIGILITLLSLHSPFAADSTIYAADVAHLTIREQKLHSSIIDYCLDDFLYVLTKRYLYKLDPDDLHIKDRTILPQTYSSMCTNASKILLMSAGEIVILAKSHLAYESGIGIRYGDFRPLVSPQGRTIAPDETSLYMIEDEGTESILKIIDLNTGGVRKKLKTSKITAYRYDISNRTLTTIDAKNHLQTYDLAFRNLKTTPLPVTPEWFLSNRLGFWLGSRSGVFMIRNNGTLIDLQPLLTISNRSYEDFIFITDQDIVTLDTLTLRVKTIVPNVMHISRLFSVDHPSYVIGMDENQRFYFIQTTTMEIHPRAEHKTIPMEIPPALIPLEQDSLWYLQIGAFSNPDNALHLYQEFRDRAIPVFIDTGEVYRVKLGGFPDKQLGIYIADRLNINGWFSLRDKIFNTEFVDFFVDKERFLLKNGMITRSNP